MLIGDAIVYPFRGQNLGLMGVGAGFACIPPVIWAILPKLPYVGLIGAGIEMLVIWYIMIFFYSVMESGTKGEAVLPGWPQIDDTREMMNRVLHMLAPLLICFLPMIAYWLYLGISGALQGVYLFTPERVWITAGLGFCGLCYLPIALLIFHFYGEIQIFNVIAAARSIFRMPGDYAAVAALLVVLFGLHGAISAFTARFEYISVPISALGAFYVFTVAMRAIGLLYHRNRERLDWERDQRAAK